jgi:hypothetical protein
MISVYAQGKIVTAREGQRASEFGDSASDYVLRSDGAEGGSRGLSPVDGNYQLKDGDSLFVTKRGQAGRVAHLLRRLARLQLRF